MPTACVVCQTDSELAGHATLQEELHLRFVHNLVHARTQLVNKYAALRKSAAPIRMPLHQSLVAALQSERRCTRISWQSPIRVTAPLKRVASFPHPSSVEC